ncbi:hypothetical protein KM043_007939 [Ampulex compressa]|nr:hypothetical protein KM043_007939 [Ampulex compressa]
MYILAITLLADLCDNLDDLSIVTDDGCIFAGLFVVIFVVMNFRLRQHRIMRLVETALECGEGLCQSAVEDVSKIVEGHILLARVVYYGFGALGFVLLIALIFFVPLEEGALPIRAKCPFDTTISPWHEIGFTIEFLAVSGGLTAIVLMENVTLMTCGVLIMSFQVLNVNFRNCRSTIDHEESQNNMAKGNEFNSIYHCSSNDPRDWDSKRASFMQQIETCVKFHQKLVFAVKEYNEIYNSSMLAQMLSSTSMICLSSFQAVVITGQSSNVVKFMIYFSAAVSQIFYICWIGNELTYASSLVCNNLWLSQWNYEALSKVGQMILLSTLFSRQTIVLQAGKLFTLSMETFTAIMRGSYSFFTVLRNMHQEE